MGMVMQFAFGAVQAAGAFIGLKMGLAFATFFDPGSGTNIVVLSRILVYDCAADVLGLERPPDRARRSWRPASRPCRSAWVGLTRLGFEMLARYSGVVFTTGTLLALPVVAPLLTVSLGLGILNRAAPQLTVFSIGFPTSLIFGLVLLMIMMGHYGGFLERLFTHAFSNYSSACLQTAWRRCSLRP
jgi:flagellar biosynthetic protein FliR